MLDWEPWDIGCKSSFVTSCVNPSFFITAARDWRHDHELIGKPDPVWNEIVLCGIGSEWLHKECCPVSCFFPASWRQDSMMAKSRLCIWVLSFQLTNQQQGCKACMWHHFQEIPSTYECLHPCPFQALPSWSKGAVVQTTGSLNPAY